MNLKISTNKGLWERTLGQNRTFSDNIGQPRASTILYPPEK